MKIALPPLLALTLLNGCGGPSKFGQAPTGRSSADAVDTAASDDTDAEKSASKRKTALNRKPEPRPAALEECSAVGVHENMEHCDADDLAVQQQTTALQEAEQSQGAETPPPAEAPAEETASTTPPATPPAEVPSTPSTPPAPPKDPNIVEFRIKAGTGSQPWNTQGEMVIAKVGQTVRVINDDTVNHRLHTNGAPCPHGSNFSPGEAMECVVTRAFDPTTRGPLYDHIVGPSAAFWVMAIP